MNYLVYLTGLIVPIISFFLQSYPRFFNKHFGVDVWTRFLEADMVRKNNHRIPGKITKGFIIQGNFDYPPLFPWILSFVPKKALEKLQGFVSPFFDAIQCLVVFIIAYQLTNNLLLALLAQVIYMTIIIVALENSYLTPRSFGYLNLTLALYPLLLYTTNHNNWALITGYIFATLIFLSHRFATQSFLFASIFFTIYERNPFYLIIFILGFLTALLLTKGYYLRVLQGHWMNIYFWIINYEHRWSHQLVNQSKTETKKDFVSIASLMISKLSPITLIGLNCWLLSAFLLMFLRLEYYSLGIVASPIYTKFAAWILFFYFWAILILSVKRLLPIGEGQRYLEMATVPSTILTSVLFFRFLNSPYRVIALIILGGMLVINLSIIIFAQMKIVIKDRTRSRTKDMDNAFEFINKLKEKRPRIICVPHQITTMTLYNSKADVLVNADNHGLVYGGIMDFYPILKKSIKDLAKQYKLDYLLLRESYASMSALKMNKKDIVFKSGDVLLIRLKK
jgi:hypothetical protein